MSRIVHLSIVSSFAAVAMTAVIAVAAPRASADPQASRLATYTSPTGTQHFALSLKPQLRLPAPSSHRIVVLFDTSASQTGAYRDDGLRALEALLGNLGEKDSAALFAVDLRAVPMSKSFVQPDGDAMKAALTKLKARTPLGTTDMAVALSAAGRQFKSDGKPDAARHVVYIGDGVSLANLMAGGQLENLLEWLVERRISVSSFAIGPKNNAQLLATIANHTGGMLAIDNRKTMPQEFGQFLAVAARQPVYWPAKVNWPEGYKVYPENMPPLRVDRDSIVVGTIASSEPAKLSMRLHVGTKSLNMSWNLRPEASSDDHNYLPQLVEVASRDGGATLPTVGSAGLREMKRLYDNGVRLLNMLSEHAMATGNYQHAERLRREAARRDPNSPTARHLQNASQRRKTTKKLVLKPAFYQDDKVPAAPPAKDFSGDGDLLKAFEQDTFEPSADDGKQLGASVASREVEEQRLQSEVESRINDGRKLMSTDPKAVISDLKELHGTVKLSQNVRAVIRSQLLSLVEGALRLANNELDGFEQRQQNDARIRAARLANELLRQQLEQDQEKLKRLMQSFNSLVAEGEYAFADEQIGPLLEGLPGKHEGLTTAAIRSAQLGGAYRDALAIQNARHKGMVASLHQVEKSAIPFQEEPPIVYPDAEIWEELTLRRKKYAAVDLAQRGGAEERIGNALRDETEFEFLETPLQEVIDFLKEFHDIEIQVDSKALEDVGIGTDTPVTRNLKGITLRSALRLMLRELELTYVIRDEVLLITTPEEAETQLSTKVYPVADLILPIPDARTLGGGALGGFGGGQQGGGGMGGGGGGGMGGGGMGGGGFGGGGGGMGGGGGFNVADPIVPRPQAGGGQNFAVPDAVSGKLSLKKSTAGSPATKGPARTRKAAKLPARIKLAVGAHGDLAKAWDAFFIKQRKAVDKADDKQRERAMKVLNMRVVVTARDLVKEHTKAIKKNPESTRKLDELLAMLQSALRQGFPQPWMYERMGVAMQLRGDDKHEIERAVMSAVDFSSSAVEMMYVAQYMSRIGLERRALQIFRQASVLEPTRPEAYERGLKLAEGLKDADGVMWAALGILSQGWPADSARIWSEARATAEAQIAKLRKAGHGRQADKYQAALAEATIYDVLVRVTWTGDADIDLMVEDPTGSMVSYRALRSSGGGVLLGDAVRTGGTDGRLAADASTETYICPKGFDGRYRMLVRRVWGKVPTGKVRVDVYTHYGSKDQKHYSKEIALADKDALVPFNLKNGRRTEPLAQHQLASAVAGMDKARKRAILGQRLGAYQSRAAARSLDLSRRQTQRIADDPRFRNRDAVGFQPVIIWLPEGANFAATAVISADRRYVRITSLPFFSQVGQVRTFNFATGETTTDDPNAPPGGGGGLNPIP